MERSCVGPLNVTPFFPYASEWVEGEKKRKIHTTENSVHEVSGLQRGESEQKRGKKRKNSPFFFSELNLSLFLARFPL